MIRILLMREGRQGTVEKPTLAKSQYGVGTNAVTDRIRVKKENNKNKCLHDEVTGDDKMGTQNEEVSEVLGGR